LTTHPVPITLIGIPMKPRAFSYLRMSTTAQLAGDSLRRQLTAAREYAERNNLNLQEEDQLSDLGISAFYGANVAEGTGLGDFIAAVRGGRVPAGSVLLVEDLDRLSRQAILKSIGLLVELLTSGVSIVTLSNGRTYTAATGSGDLILSIITMERAHDESRVKQVGLSVWKKKRSDAHLKPMTAMAPKWLRLDKDRGRFEVIEERAVIVRSIFEHSAAGLGIYAITERLNRVGTKSFGGTRGPGRGWHCSYVSRLLSNRAVLGEMQPAEYVDRLHRRPVGDPVKDYFPRIVSDELFWRAQAGLKARRGRGGRKGDNVANIFAGGILRCAYCGSGMARENKARKNGASFLCGGARRGLRCVRTRWSYTDFEESFLSFCSEVDLESIMQDEASTRDRTKLGDEIVALRGRISEVQDQRGRTYELFLGTTTAQSFVGQKLDELEKRRVELEGELKEKEGRLAAMGADANRSHEVTELVRKLQQRDGDNYALRAQVAQKIRSLVSIVHVATEGHAPLVRRTIDFLRTQTSSDDVIAHLERQLESEEEHRRYFSVAFRGGSVRIVFPEKDDPTKVHVQVTSSPDEGLMRRYPDHDEQAFPPRLTASDLDATD
jgi:DNA invertase Pin-like site-specific DNA recombinase